MDFLNYEDNGNLGIVHLSSNSIKSLCIPENLETLTIAFNRIENLESLTPALRSNSSLKILDLTGNPVCSIYNFQFEVLLHARKLTSLNSFKITNSDVDAAL